MSIPKVGDRIYVPTDDDIVGGLATITYVKLWDGGSRGAIKVHVNPACSYGWSYLEEEQEELQKEWGDKEAHIHQRLN